MLDELFYALNVARKEGPELAPDQLTGLIYRTTYEEGGGAKDDGKCD